MFDGEKSWNGSTWKYIFFVWVSVIDNDMDFLIASKHCISLVKIGPGIVNIIKAGYTQELIDVLNIGRYMHYFSYMDAKDHTERCKLS